MVFRKKQNYSLRLLVLSVAKLAKNPLTSKRFLVFFQFFYHFPTFFTFYSLLTYIINKRIQ